MIFVQGKSLVLEAKPGLIVNHLFDLLFSRTHRGLAGLNGLIKLNL